MQSQPPRCGQRTLVIAAPCFVVDAASIAVVRHAFAGLASQARSAR
jgi:hypothetical protein